MKHLSVILLLLSLVSVALAAEQSSAFLSPIRNAQFVYVTSYDGPEFSPNLLPSDRRAISNVEDALQKSRRYIIVFRPQEADMIIAVESRPSEDVFAVYDRQSWRDGAYLWRVTGKNGLSSPGVPLVQQFEAALAKVSGKKAG